MHADIELAQTHQGADVAVNLPQNGAIPAADFDAQVEVAGQLQNAITFSGSGFYADQRRWKLFPTM
jgi:hypothetical protein